MNENLQTQDGEIQIVSLKDEDGNDKDFEILDELEYEDVNYCALMPYYGDSEDLDSEKEEDTDIIIVRFYKDENGEEYCESIEDDDLFDKVAALFDERIEKMYEE